METRHMAITELHDLETAETCDRLDEH